MFAEFLSENQNPFFGKPASHFQSGYCESIFTDGVKKGLGKIEKKFNYVLFFSFLVLMVHRYLGEDEQGLEGLGHHCTCTPYPQPLLDVPGMLCTAAWWPWNILLSDCGCAHPCWARSDKGVNVLILITCYNTANAELVPSFLQEGCGTFKMPGLI